MLDRRFHFDQGYYGRADSISLYALLRLFSPRRIVEIGSGFSSALMMDVNDRFLSPRAQLTFIDPYPDRLESVFRPGDSTSTSVLRQSVQTTGREVFEELEANDFLFIDSSHVSKVGSDVNYLFDEIIPTLAPGVVVHVHDVFWPFEYPPNWIREGQAWNEAYLVRAFLSFNSKFNIMLWTSFAGRMWPDMIRQRLPSYMQNTGGSLWFRRVG